ncbi:MAG: Mur ligase domain-containing protein, partial [Candidatus Omnitrophota bacterium]
MRRIKNIHFIGIGGIGMSGIAKLLLKKGINISGSDIKRGIITEQLEKEGAKIFIGHDKLNIPHDTELVVYSSAIKPNNHELKEAKNRKIKIFKRAEMLAELMKDKTVISVTGAHGKTTTASLVAYLLLEAGFCPNVAVGGMIRNTKDNACSGNGKYFVAEADESDGSFLYYRPTYSIITNIDFEHIDFYKNWSGILNTFKKFSKCTKKNGCIIACGDDKNLREVLKSSKVSTLFFGFSKSCDCYAKNIKLKEFSCEFDCFFKNKKLGHFKLNIAGRHNILNSLPTIILSKILKIGIKKTINILA